MSSNRQSANLFLPAVTLSRTLQPPNPPELARPRSEAAWLSPWTSEPLDRASSFSSVMRKASALKKEKKSDQTSLPVYSGSFDWQKFYNPLCSRTGPLATWYGCSGKHNRGTDFAGGEKTEKHWQAQTHLLVYSEEHLGERHVCSKTPEVLPVELSDLRQYIVSWVCLAAQPCLTLCNAMDCSLTDSSAHGFPGKNPGMGGSCPLARHCTHMHH